MAIEYDGGQVIRAQVEFIARVLQADLRDEGFEAIVEKETGALIVRVALSSGDVVLRCHPDEAWSATFSIRLVPRAVVPSALTRIAADLLRVLNLQVTLGAFTLGLDGAISFVHGVEMDEALIQPGVFRRTIRRLLIEADTFLPLIQVLLEDAPEVAQEIDPFEEAGFGLWEEIGAFPIEWIIRYASARLDQ